jgi:hypothetical protein
MIISDPTTTRKTIRMPNASANTLLVFVGTCRDVQEKHEMDTHLSNREHDKAERDTPAHNSVLRVRHDRPPIR